MVITKIMATFYIWWGVGIGGAPINGIIVNVIIPESNIFVIQSITYIIWIKVMHIFSLQNALYFQISVKVINNYQCMTLYVKMQTMSILMANILF